MCAESWKTKKIKMNGSHSNVQKLCLWSKALVSLSLKLTLNKKNSCSWLQSHRVLSSLSFAPHHTNAEWFFFLSPSSHTLWFSRLMFGMRVFLYSTYACITVCVSHMLDRSSWQVDESLRVFGLHRVNMVIWVLKLLLLPIDGCWYLVSEPMYLCRCHLRHFLLISPWTYNGSER